MAAGTPQTLANTLGSLARQLHRVGEELDVILCESHHTLVEFNPQIEQTLTECATRLQETATMLETEVRHTRSSSAQGAPATPK